MRYVVKITQNQGSITQSYDNVLGALNSFVRQMWDIPGNDKTVSFDQDGLTGWISYEDSVTVLELVKFWDMK
jgi:hypothetical protein